MPWLWHSCLRAGSTRAILGTCVNRPCTNMKTDKGSVATDTCSLERLCAKTITEQACYNTDPAFIARRGNRLCAHHCRVQDLNTRHLLELSQKHSLGFTYKYSNKDKAWCVSRIKPGGWAEKVTVVCVSASSYMPSTLHSFDATQKQRGTLLAVARILITCHPHAESASRSSH
jgi:hypothetical protein